MRDMPMVGGHLHRELAARPDHREEVGYERRVVINPMQRGVREYQIPFAAHTLYRTQFKA